MMERIINVPVKIDEEFISDVLCTAFEGGITYWCDVVKPIHDVEGTEYMSEVVAQGGSVLLHLAEGPIEDDGPDAYELDADKFCKGLEKFWQAQTTGAGMVDADAGNFDADLADAVVQYAIFGELVFG